MSPLTAVTATVDQLRLIWSFSPRITSVAWLLFITVMMVYYSALSWMPTILADQGYGASVSFMATTLMSVTGIVGVVFSIIIVEIFGRKWVIGIAATISSTALVIFALVLEFQVAAAVMIGIFGFFILVTIPVLYAYVSELYPTNLRASGFGWASSVSRSVTGFLPILFVNVLWPVLGLPLTFTLLGVLLLGAVIWMAVAAPETKGRSLDKIISQDDVAQAVAERAV